MARGQTQSAVLFVCLGNICRSPAGEGVFRRYVERRGCADRFRIDSAGTSDYHNGQRADRRMREAAARRGYELDSRARQVTRADLEEFDLVIAMDRDNLRELERLASGPRDNIRLLGAFLPEHEGGNPSQAPEVPDPYFGGAEGFEGTLDMIERACPALFAAAL